MFKIKDILHQLTGIQFLGDENWLLSRIVSISDIAEGEDYSNCIIWISDKNEDSLLKLMDMKLGLIILTPFLYEKANKITGNFLLCDNPRLVFAKILKLKFAKKYEAGIELSAQIDPTSTIDSTCYIGKNVVIEKNVVIGKGSVVMHNTIVLEDTIIGENCNIGCNNTIGNYGFGYEKNEDGEYQTIEHNGRVVISNNVHIHNNVCIDRAVLGQTFIGENSLIIANSMIGGSVFIGENCWIAPSSTIKNKIKIAKNTLAGLGCVILKDTTDNSTMIGNPAIKMEEYKKWSQLKELLYMNHATDLK